MPTRKKRRSRWYDRGFTPTDPRLWLYGPVPAGFWKHSENRHCYMDWLGEQLGYTQPEDWYQISAHAIRTRRGSRLVRECGGTLIGVLRDYLPNYNWLEWRLTMVPKGFWEERVNRHRYLDWLGPQLGFTQPEDWYQITGNHLTQWYGATLRKHFGGSVIAVVKDYLPQYEWKEWLFVSVPQRFWQDRKNRHCYLDWLGQQLGFRRLEDWYQITYDDFVRWHGSALLSYFDDSRLAILQDYRPKYKWLEWRFTMVSDGFWDSRTNRCRYLDWLGQQLGFTGPDDWYQLSERDLQQHHGSRLLHKFRSSPSAIVKDYLPRHRWQEWRFAHAPNKFWQEAANCHRYLDWLGRHLGFRRPEDWYRLSERHLREWYGGCLLKKFGGSPSAIVKDYLPRYRWQEWRFVSVPKGFWEELVNRRRYLDWLGKHLGFRRHEDWYTITSSDFTQWYGGSLLNVYNGSVQALVKEYLPHYDWKEWLFVSTPQRFWQDAHNRRRYLEWLGTELGFRCPEDWYTLSTRQVRAHHGSRLLEIIGNSRMAVLQAYLPTYDWQEWLLSSVPARFWEEPKNRRRYLDWLGTQLGYQRAEDWHRLRATDLLSHHGEQLLTYFQRQVVAIVSEYLHVGRRRETAARPNRE